MMPEPRRTHLQRVPPHDLATEAELLGCALRSHAAAEVASQVDPGDFYRPAHGQIAHAVALMVAAGEPVDAGTVSAKLRRLGLLDAAGGNDTILGLLANTVGSPAYAATHADHIRHYARQRHVLAIAAEIADAVYSGTTVAGHVAELAAAHADELQHTKSSWEPVNLAAVLAGDGQDDPPAMLARTDGVKLLYAGKVSTLSGEPESGKSWVAIRLCCDAIEAGEHVLYVDFEDSAAGVVNRLLALGASPNAILERVHYIRPEDPIDTSASVRLQALLDAYHPTVGIVDGVTEAMVANGWATNDNDDVARFYSLLARPIARSGAACLVLDHVTKDRETRGRWAIGGQHKLAGIDGISYTLETIKPFSRDTAGMSKLVVNKDRPGHVRTHCVGLKLAGEVHFSSLSGGIVVAVEIRPGADTTADNFRPDVLMEKVSRWLELQPTPASFNAVTDAVSGKEAGLRRALEVLAGEGYVAREEGPRKSLLHRSVRPFRRDEATDSVHHYTESEEF